eukprot:3874379-Prymnesium_polylepis.1
MSLRAMSEDVHVAAREHRRARWRALCVLHVCLLKADRRRRERVEVWSRGQREAIRREGLGAKRVGEHEGEIQSRRRRVEHGRAEAPPR